MTQARARRDPGRVASGDWQTPPALAEAIVDVLRAQGFAPASVIEPTCGVGAFLRAAARAWPEARQIGVEREPAYAEAARRGTGAQILEADAYTLDWAALVRAQPGPVLVLGNPPWVTRAGLGRLGVVEGPPREPGRGGPGLAGLMGASNIDVATWLIGAWLDALRPGDRLAVLCKTSAAREVLAGRARRGLVHAAALRTIPARGAFGVAVDATLLVVSGAGGDARWPVHARLDDPAPSHHLALIDGQLTHDADAWADTAWLAGRCPPGWRSGVKHDCVAVLELVGAPWHNGLGEVVDVEEEALFPLLKGSDLARGRLDAPRALLLPQARLGEDPAGMAARSPRAWAYLCAHRAAFEARRSRVYRGRPDFSIFGVGPYSFAPWKVALGALYKAPVYQVLGPRDGRPILLDDTCLFLPFEDEAEARAAAAALARPEATRFLQARVMLDQKRPWTRACLQQLDWRKLL